jgi:hypothetical protein
MLRQSVLVSVFVGLVAGGSSEVAVAQSADEAPTRTVSYRAPLLIGDGLALAGLGFGVGTDYELLAVSGYVLVGPVVHAAHGNYGVAAISFFARLALPVIGFTLAAEAGSCADEGTGCSTALKIGSGVGVALASGLDLLLASRHVEQEPTAPLMSFGGVGFDPSVTAGADHVTIGFAGGFD